MTTDTPDSTLQPPLENDIHAFLNHLHDVGYAEYTLHKKQSVLRCFAQWIEARQITPDGVNDNHVTAFAARSPGRGSASVAFELSVLRAFFRHLRPVTELQDTPAPEDVSSAAGLLRCYEGYLRRDCGLSEKSLHVYVPFIRHFLASQATPTGCVSPPSFDTLLIRDFVLGQTRNRSAEYVRLLATALRSFFRFLFLSGLVLRDLAPSVPRVCKYRQAAPPAFLSPDEIERVLTATDRSTPTGRRDYAILLLLARLGLRAGEIVSLELDDIRWRAGEIVVRGKGRIVDQLPLLCDIGEALAAYLREDRGGSASRRIFLRIWAPCVGLTGPAAVGHIVRLALARASVRRSGRGAAHLFRHGLATKMIRNDASMSEISEVLRHRSLSTTATYAQVSFEALRTVAQCWPATGGVR
jgi:integrase/recombinase XerD